MAKLVLEEKMKYEVGGNEIEPIKACFFYGLKNEKPTAEGREVWHFHAREQRNNEHGEVSPGGTT